MRMVGVQTGSLIKKIGIDEEFRLIHECGFDCVDFDLDCCISWNEIVNGEFSFFERDMADILKDMRPYKEAAEKYGVAFGQAHAPTPSFVKDNPRGSASMLEVLKKCVAICGYLNCPHFIVHPVFNAYEESMDLIRSGRPTSRCIRR